MDYCRTDRDKMIAGVMAAVLATQGTAWASAWALAVGFGLNINENQEEQPGFGAVLLGFHQLLF